MRRSPHGMPEAIAPSARGSQTDAEVLEGAHRLVELYLAYLREHETGIAIFDTRELPSSKEGIVTAFRVVIATENRAEIRASLVKAGMTLAHFHDNIGEPLTVMPLPEPTRRRHCASAKPTTASMRKYDRLCAQLDEERIRLGDIFQNALRIAQKKPFHHA